MTGRCWQGKSAHKGPRAAVVGQGAAVPGQRPCECASVGESAWLTRFVRLTRFVTRRCGRWHNCVCKARRSLKEVLLDPRALCQARRCWRYWLLPQVHCSSATPHQEGPTGDAEKSPHRQPLFLANVARSLCTPNPAGGKRTWTMIFRPLTTATTAASYEDQ